MIMTVHTKGTKKIWAKIESADPEDRTRLYGKLFDKMIELADSARISVGFSALEGLLDQENFEDAMELGRRLSFELMSDERYSEATEVLDKVLSNELWVSPFETAMARWCLGTIRMKSGSLDQAEAEFVSSLSMFGDNHGTFSACVEKERAECLNLLHKKDESLIACARAISLFEEAGSLDGTALAKKQMGELLLEQESYLMAVKYLDDALGIFEFLGWTLATQQTQVLLGKAYLLLKHFDLARNVLSTAEGNKSSKEAQSLAAEASYHLVYLAETLQAEQSQALEYKRLVPILMAAGLPKLSQRAEARAGDGGDPQAPSLS
jgi:tetratricopeptide (TPR) repeat protein